MSTSPLSALSGRFVCAGGGWWSRLCCQCELPVHIQSRQPHVMGVCSAWDSGTCITLAANTLDTSATGYTSPCHLFLQKFYYFWHLPGTGYKIGYEMLKIRSHFAHPPCDLSKTILIVGLRSCLNSFISNVFIYLSFIFPFILNF